VQAMKLVIQNLLRYIFKGIVHPKNENSLIIYSLLCSFKLLLSFFCCTQQEDILKNVSAVCPKYESQCKTFKLKKEHKGTVKLIHMT